MEVFFMTSRGGRRSTTWEQVWQHGKTKVIRVPEELADQVLQYARRLDQRDCLLQGNEEEIILSAIAAYIEFRKAHRHANQHNQGRELDTNIRTW
jgi:hypothetical protein